METRVARKLASLLAEDVYSGQSDETGELERDLEFFLTWRLQLPGPPTVMWCDGVCQLLVEKIGVLAYQLSFSAYIGPTTDVSRTFLSPFKGTMIVHPSMERLRSYLLTLTYQGREYLLSEEV